jgi:DNA-binding CsgD family transcriptional regulator
VKPDVQSTHRLRLAELLAAVSLATDLSHDVAAESALRDAMLAVNLARLAGWTDRDIRDAYYLALLYHVGCTGAVAAQSRLGAGDDIAVRRWMAEVDYADRAAMMRVTATKIARHWGPSEWVRSLPAMITAAQDLPEALARVADVACGLSQRLGAPPAVVTALRHAYARWDGRIFRELPSGESLSPTSRLVHLVHVAQIYHQVGGSEAADAVVRGRSGSEFDPELARLWLQNSEELRRTFTAGSVWDEALAAEPEPHVMVAIGHLDDVTRALADFVDLKNPYTHGHSARLARLVEDAGTALGLEAQELDTLRRAAHVHDLGNVSVPDSVWIKRGPLTAAERERVRLHAYHTERIMTVSEALRPTGAVAGLHHERLDGSGYHRGLPSAALPLSSRVLAVAEMFQSMVEPRSWRPAYGRSEAAAEIRREVTAGRLDRRAADAVLSAAGQPSARGRSAWPAGLTEREVEILRLIAVGHSNKEIARGLHLSESTVHTHVINIYGKTGAKTRAGATLFALANDLIQVPAAENRLNG